MDTFSITKTIRKKTPIVPFKKIKESVLGKSFEVSLVLVGEKRSQKLNQTLRDKNAPANILTFPLSGAAGEIYITPSLVKKDAKKFGLTYKEFLAFIFIHGLLHLKGVSHGSTMEKKEKAFFEKIKGLL